MAEGSSSHPRAKDGVEYHRPCPKRIIRTTTALGKHEALFYHRYHLKFPEPIIRPLPSSVESNLPDQQEIEKLRAK